MTQLAPSLNFDGNAEEAFNFYRAVFGGDFKALMRWRDNPQCTDWNESAKNLIMHVSLEVGEGHVLMGSDTPSSFGQTISNGNNFAIGITPDSREDADRLFQGLSDGGHGEMPMQDMFWGAYFGALQDKFGVRWMINFPSQPAS